ncbi:MAG: hypothetical protein AB8I08_38390 [Sandaracinaceae bacterium]
MSARIFRGVGVGRAFARLTALATLYVGAFVVLWALGLMMRGPIGWALGVTPLVALVLARIWVWQRVSVVLSEGHLRYEGALPQRDFEVDVERIERVYFDRSLPGQPLVLSLRSGDERVLGELSKAASLALFTTLRDDGVE